MTSARRPHFSATAGRFWGDSLGRNWIRFSFFQRIVIPAATATAPVFLNINTDSANLSRIQIKFNYTVYTNGLSSHGAVCVFFFGGTILLYLNLCVLVQDRVVYQTLNTLCAGDGRLGNATVSNFLSWVQTAKQMEQLWLLLLLHLYFVCHDHLFFSSCPFSFPSTCPSSSHLFLSLSHFFFSSFYPSAYPATVLLLCPCSPSLYISLLNMKINRTKNLQCV